jgi:aconitate hydratase
MGILPLQFKAGDSAKSLGLTGEEILTIGDLKNGVAKQVDVLVTTKDGKKKKFKVNVRIDTPKEIEYYKHGGILQYVLRQLSNQ